MPRKKKISAVAIVALILAVVILTSTIVTQMTVVSLDKVTIEGVGWKDGENRWRDDYWMLYATTDTATELKLIKWNEQEAEKPTVQNTVTDPDTGETYEVIPTGEVEIRIYPQQPYYSVQLEWRQLEVYPKTYGSWRSKVGANYGKLDSYSVPKLTASFWYLTGGWAYTLHTPYTAELWKNGEKLDSVTDDSYGGKEIMLLTDDNTGQTVKITNFGKGEYGYNPPVHNDLLIFGSDSVVETTDAVQMLEYIEYDKSDMSYSNYWFGGGDIYKDHAGHWIMRWSGGDPAHFASYNKDSWVGVYLTTDFPGNEPGAGDFFNDWVIPVKGSIYSNNPDTDPQGKSLVNYLVADCGGKSFQFTYNPAIPWCQKVMIENNVLKLFMPAGSAYSDVVVRIPTELADTIVLVEYYPTAAISATWSTGGTDAEIGDKLKGLVTVQNTAYNPQTGEGFGGTLITKTYFEYGGEVGAVAPVQFTELFEKNQEKTYEFLIHNTGAGEDTEFKIIFEVWNEKPELCGSAELTGTFLKTTEISSIVTAYTRSEVGKKPLSAILVSISWDSESDSTYSNGGVAIFDLGHIEADVSLVATDPAENYLPAEAIGHVKGGENVFYLDMEAVEKPPPEEDLGWLVWVAVLCVSVVAVTAVYKKRRKISNFLK